MSDEARRSERARGRFPAPACDWHTRTGTEAMEALAVRAQGLSSAEAAARLARVGPNELQERDREGPLTIFLKQFKSFLVFVLVGAVGISLWLGETLDAGVIAAIILINAGLGFFQEYRAEQAVRALKRMTAARANVMRDGVKVDIVARELVPGDLLLLEAGDRVPADLRLTETANLMIDEAMLSGESVPSAKHTDPLPLDAQLADRENMAYTGCIVVRGRGGGLVVATGMATEMGHIAEQVQAAPERPTPLQIRLERLAKWMTAVIVMVCAALFAVGLGLGRELLDLLMTTMSLAVSAIPEGLPTAVTLALSLGLQRMARRQAIVKRLSAVETLGCTNCICSDKTGTITRNEMTVSEIALSGRRLLVTGTGYSPEGELLENGRTVQRGDDAIVATLLTAAVLCNDSALVHDGIGWRVNGDPTEGALLVLAAKGGLAKEDVEEQHPRVGEIPFDSERKRMTTVHKTQGQHVLVCTKGAPEMVLPLCAQVLDGGGPRAMTEEDRRDIRAAGRSMAGAALRVLAIAYSERDSSVVSKPPGEIEADLIFVGLVGMIDPPKPEVGPALQMCRQAGIRVIMITGDHPLTAVAVARQIGLPGAEGRALTGAELDSMSDDELAKAVDEVAIYARVSPVHKVRILLELKSRGYIVAMTGDGVNDAPALKQAHIGIAMGEKGSDVTREAADMVLADDNFSTIVAAVAEGRVVYDNLRKFVRLLLSANFDEILVICIAWLLSWPVPLLPIHILWINVVTDGLPALALGLSPAERGVMQRRPRDPHENMLRTMLPFLIVSALLMTAGTLLVYAWGMHTGGVERARTLALCTAVLFELLLAFNCQSDTHSVFRIGFPNRYLVGAVLGAVLMQIAVTQLPFAQVLLKVESLSMLDWLAVVAASAPAFFISPGRLVRPSAPAVREN